MRPEDKPQFVKLLAQVLSGYGKPLPEKDETNVWFNHLTPFPPPTIKQAFEAYCVERPDFAPTPNGIAARCKLLDGRPDENEAWAVSLTSQDERETVTWTSEMAEAFDLAKPLLAVGDEIGARMAFKDAYKRLVIAARSLNRPVRWSTSAGWDAGRHQLAHQDAVNAGLLDGPKQPLALPNESGQVAGKPEGLKRVMEALAQMEDPQVKLDRLNATRLAEAERIDREQREEVERKTREYLQRHPEARYGELLKLGKVMP
jgi:hypothetical protein